MVYHKRLKEGGTQYDKILQVEALMEELGVRVFVSMNANNGLVFEVDGVHVTALCGNLPSDSLPREFDSRFILSDQHGNPKEYDDEMDR